jgi:hypothetical protein
LADVAVIERRNWWAPAAIALISAAIASAATWMWLG